MKALLQFATSVVAVGALLSPLASSATNIAELPLKASVLAKPNVIFGMDDSGSMDWEVLLDTEQGMFYWDPSSATGWSGTTKPLSTSSIDPFQYLFPMGTANGGALNGPTSQYGRVIPPIPQLAWARSFAFNPLYYNPSVTYKFWSPAYFGGSLKSYANATTTAAKSHPAVSASQTINLTQNWNAANSGSLFTDNNFLFRAAGGMTLPVGTVVKATNATTAPCISSGSTQTMTAATTVASTRECTASIPYYPATFWQPTVCPSGVTDCTPAPDCTVDGSTCVAAPNGSGKLRRYEIKSGNFPNTVSSRSYADEMQNFANWFTYYRKRKLMLAASMGQVLENITGLRMAVARFNSHSSNISAMNDADSTTQSNNRLATAGAFYLNAMSFDSTPTLGTMKYIGGQFDTNTNVIQYACQRNSAFIVTDGFANDYPLSSGVTYSQGTYGTGSPYATTTTKSQADIALAFYTKQLRGSGGSALAAGLVPPSTSSDPAADKNPNLHMNTYAISLGAKGVDYYPGRDAYASPPTWPTPVNNDPTMIDDLWHATINGRGKMYLATTPQATFTSIDQGLNDILNGSGAQSGVSVSSVNLSRGDGYAYMARYNPSRWQGDLTANSIDSSTGQISTTSAWSAATLLAARSWTTRKIMSQASTGGGVVFNEAGVGATVNPSSTWGVTVDVMNYLRGDRSGEGSTFRTRASLMGAVINAEPVISREDNVVYVASGEGMLHAFDTASGSNRGQELWAFVPRAVLPDIGQTSGRHYSFKTQLDGTPVIGKVGTTKLLVAGMGAAGNSYYALDVTTPRSNDESSTTWVKWEFPSPSDAGTVGKIGQTMGKPAIVNTSAGYRVLVTSGYNSTTDTKGRLFVLDPANGSITKEFVTASGASDTGLTHVAPFLEDDGTVRYVYGGDLLGNVWRFDLTAATGATANKVAVLKDSSGNVQPVTAAPELAYIKGQRVILIGTGRLLDATDFGNSQRQTFYAIADGATLSNARSSLVQQTYTHTGDALTTSPVDWSTQRGWYMDLPTGEHANTRPTFNYGSVAFTTNVTGATDCTATSYLYVIDVGTGGKSVNSDYVSAQISNVANVSAALAVLTAGPPGGQGAGGGGGGGGPGSCPEGSVIAIMQTTDGKPYTKCISKPGNLQASKNSWREVRPR